MLPNEGFLGRRDGGWSHHGDPVDVALLVMAHKLGITRAAVEPGHPQLASIPYESERGFAASVHATDNGNRVFVKGALERLLPMCDSMDGSEPARRA